MEPATYEAIKQEILAQSKTAIDEVTIRCQEAAEHLGTGTYLGALGVLAGLEERIGYLNTILKLLSHWEEAQRQQRMNFP